MTVSSLAGPSSSQEQRFPDFLCIGAQKAGTTWLDANLRRDPEIWMPWIKEIQYFNDVHIPAHRNWTRAHRQRHAENAARRLVKRSEGARLDLRTMHAIASLAAEPISDDWYGRIFSHAGPHQICGEITPEYSLLPPEGVAHVKRLCPQLKVIFLMRDPIERCWSHIRMLASRQSGIDIERLAEQDDVIARCDYARILDRWTGAFGPDRIFAADFEQIIREPEALLTGICDFLGVKPHAATLRRAAAVVFPGQEMPMPPRIRGILEARLADIYRSNRQRADQPGGAASLEPFDDNMKGPAA